MKRKLITFRRIVRTGVVNFGRNVSLAAAAIAVMVVTLTIVLFSIVANATFSNTLKQITNKINISLYLSDDVTPRQVQTLQNQLKQLPNVKKVVYVSKTQALADYKVQNANNTQLLRAINQTDNPLPASIEIHPVDTNKIQSIKEFLDKPENKKLQDPQAGTSYSGDRKVAIDKISHATRVIQQAGVIAVIVFAFISVLIIFNTLRMAIFNRRDEIGIMRLLGASTWFIRGPFVVESIMYGVISALVSVAIIDVLFLGSASTLQASSLGLLDISYANTFFKENFWRLLTLQLMVGMLIGAASSVIATRRYLKLKPPK